MPIAHTCPSCGLNLTRIPAPLDPIYRLPIVVCPGCREAIVRHADGHRAVPRAVSRTRLAIVTMIANALWTLIAAIACAGISIGMAGGLRESGLRVWPFLGMLVGVVPRDDRFAGWMDEHGTLNLLTWAGVNVLIGAFLAGALPHLRRRLFVPLFTALVILLMFIPDTIGLIESVADGQVEQLRTDTLAIRFNEAINGLRLLPAAALPALAGIPIARRLTRSAQIARARARRRLRNRVRRRRQGQ